MITVAWNRKTETLEECSPMTLSDVIVDDLPNKPEDRTYQVFRFWPSQDYWGEMTSLGNWHRISDNEVPGAVRMAALIGS